MEPRHAELTKALIHDITSGVYPVGSSLPGELALAEKHGVSRGTVRVALMRIQELGLVRSGSGYRSSSALVSELVLSVEFVQPVAVIKTPPGTANMVARRIDEAGLPGVAGTVAGDDTIIAVLRKPGAGRALKELLANAG